MQINISQIVIKDRFRTNYGDIDGLAESISSIGQLQPIAVDSNYNLIFGERRIKAFQLLGLDSIEGNVIHLENNLEGEYAENEFSEGWAVSEKVAILKAIETKAHGDQSRSENFPTASEAAKTAGFGNERTARDATKVVDNGIPELVEKLDTGEVSVSAGAKISSFEDDEQQEIIEEINAGAKPVEVIKAHVAQNSGNNEWYTPSKFIEAAKSTMSSIDLDPASSEIANKTVGATRYYTEKSNGLTQQWSGNVWMNPPYAQPLIRDFSDKLCNSIGSIKQACVLVNNATETTWFQNMAIQANAICFTNKRIKFLDTKGNEGAPLQGQAILYFGNNVEGFDHNFSEFGFVVCHV